MTDHPIMPSFDIALYQPDIPGNTGTILRLGACLNFTTHIIEPAGFDLSDRSLKRAGMDYLKLTHFQRHLDWDHFVKWCAQHNKSIVLVTTKSRQTYTDYQFQPNDIALFGRESAGVPDHVHNLAAQRLYIPMQEPARSINLAMSVAMIAGEMARQFRLS